MANLLMKRRSSRLMRRVVAVGIAAVFGLPGSTTGQAGSSAGAPNRTEILFLGTAGGPPLRLDRSEPSTLLIVDGRPYLIDCGIGTMRRMLQAVTGALDRLLPPQPLNRELELPSEWFKYPPI